MALWTCGFEAGDTSYYSDLGWTFLGDANTQVITTAGRQHSSFNGRGGSRSVNLSDDMVSPSFGTGGRWLHFWMEALPVGSSPVSFGVEFWRNGLPNCSVRVNSTGTMDFRRGNFNGSILGSAGSFHASIAHWWAIEVVCANSAGLMRVYIDGVLAGEITSVDTQNTPLADWDQISIQANNLGVAFDDFIVTTGTEGRLGEHFLTSLIPDGNDSIGSGVGSTGGAGSFTNVNEIPPDDGTTYNEFTAAGTDRYTTGNLSFTPASIHSVTVLGKAARDGVITQAQTVCATDSQGGGVTETLGAVTGLGAAGVYVPWQDVFITDPDTSTAILAVTVGVGGNFDVAGDLTGTIVNGSTIEVTGSTGNDGFYKVASTSFVTNTTIVVEGTVPSGTVDGNITYNFTGSALNDLRIGVKFS